MIRALLDTNVLASAIVGASVASSTAGALFRRWRRDDFVLITSDSILTELERTLNKAYFRDRLMRADLEGALRTIRGRSEHATISIDVIGIASHPEDDLVLAAAGSAQVDYLITGDRMLLKLRVFDGVTILNSGDFLAALDRTDPTLTD